MGEWCQAVDGWWESVPIDHSGCHDERIRVADVM